LKKSFFSQTRPWANKIKYYPQACLKQTRLFLKNNKPKPFDGIIREIATPWIASLASLLPLYSFLKSRVG